MTDVAALKVALDKTALCVAPALDQAIEVMLAAVTTREAIMICGNGGSHADSLHFVGELVGRFRRVDRSAINAVALGANGAALTAWANDRDFNDVFAREVEAIQGGLLIAISTSGQSENVIRAARKAMELGIPVIGMTGAGMGRLAAFCDLLLPAQSTHTWIIQQVHLALYHFLCGAVEEALLSSQAT